MRHQSNLMAIFIVVMPGLEIISANPGVTGLQLNSVQKYGVEFISLRDVESLTSCKEADNSFEFFSNGFTLKDEYCHCLTSDATIMVSVVRIV